MAATIPEDLLIEVLSRLPTKSLHRFQCVSHLWFTFITHISSQRTPILPLSGLFLYRDVNFCPEDKGFYAPFKDDDFKSRLARFPFYPQASVLDNCNGLFLFGDKDWNGDPPFVGDYYVCNPATNEFVLLPDSPLNIYSSGFLAFDPRDSPHDKVFLFTINHPDIIVEMYSSMTGTWVMFSSMLSSFNYVESHVFHNRALYMITLNHDGLVRFNTDRGSFNVTKLPRRDSPYEVGRIGESRGRLYYADNDLFPPKEVRIYMLDEQSADKWLLIHILSTVKGMTDHLYGVIAFHPESEVVYLSIPGKVLSCDPRTGKLEEFWSSGKMEKFWSSEGYTATEAFFVSYCLESLNPPGGRFINPFALDVK